MSKNNDGTINWADKMCKTGVWFTPPRILVPTHSFFKGQIPYDPCTTPNNPTDARRWTSDIDGGNGLETDWIEESEGEGIFINPPYGKDHGMHAFLERIHYFAEANLPIIALLPCGSRFSTKYWQKDMFCQELTAACWPLGRIKFLDANGVEQGSPPMDNQIYGFNVDPGRFGSHYNDVGKCYGMSRLF